MTAAKSKMELNLVINISLANCNKNVSKQCLPDWAKQTASPVTIIVKRAMTPDIVQWTQVSENNRLLLCRFHSQGELLPRYERSATTTIQNEAFFSWELWNSPGNTYVSRLNDLNIVLFLHSWLSSGMRYTFGDSPYITQTKAQTSISIVTVRLL